MITTMVHLTYAESLKIDVRPYPPTTNNEKGFDLVGVVGQHRERFDLAVPLGRGAALAEALRKAVAP